MTTVDHCARVFKGLNLGSWIQSKQSKKNHYFNFISIVTSFLCVVKIIGEYSEHKEKALSREKQREATKISVRLLLIFLLACSVRSPRFNTFPQERYEARPNKTSGAPYSTLRWQLSHPVAT